MVPKTIRDRVWNSYRKGQEDDKRPSVRYLHAARDAVIAVAKLEGLEPDTHLYDLVLKAMPVCGFATLVGTCDGAPGHDGVHNGNVPYPSLRQP